MSYTKQTWANGDLITADKLNHMEDGIASSAPWIIEMTFVDDGNIYLSSTAQWDDVAAAVCSGRTVMIKLPNTEESIGYGIRGAVFTILGYSPVSAYEENDDLLIPSSYYSGTVGTFGYLYKDDGGYMCGYVYVD